MEIDDETWKEIFLLAKSVMNVLKEVYNSESVYLYTMCDGPMNYFNIQLIPRYSFEKRNSKNFVKPRMEYKEDKEKLKKLRNLFKIFRSETKMENLYIIFVPLGTEKRTMLSKSHCI